MALDSRKMDVPLTQHAKQGSSLFSLPPSPFSADSDNSTLPSEAPPPSEASGCPRSWGAKDLEVNIVPTLGRADRVGGCLGTHSNLRVS